MSKIDTVAIYRRLNRPRAELPPTRSGTCASACDEERQGRAACKTLEGGCKRLDDQKKWQARGRRPVRAELPAERADACRDVCVATVDGHPECTTTCQVLNPSTDRARAGRPRSFAEMARDVYGVNPTPTKRENDR